MFVVCQGIESHKMMTQKHTHTQSHTESGTVLAFIHQI